MKLEKSGFSGYKGPVVVIVMDGIGLSDRVEGNAVKQAYTPTLDRIMAQYPTVKLRAHGTAVGLPSDDDMGNSEVGHNAIGAGKVYSQGAKLVAQSIETGKMFANQAWQDVSGNVVSNNSTLHFIGLFSDGNVHSHIDHLKAMVNQAKEDGVKTVRIHILLDGRDVGETSALEYVQPFEAFLSELNDGAFDARIASGGGRMNITMDRYEADWSMVQRGWYTHVLGEGRQFASAEEAITTYRSEAKVIDQDLPAFVIAENGNPIGTIEDGDSVVFYNFRGDRAIEISKAFETENFTEFDRKRFPKVVYAGMLEYDGDLHIPSRYLVSPPEILNTMSELLVNSGVSQMAVSETQKYGHVTYFWNGNKSGKFSETLETYFELPSDNVSFDTRPWMKAVDAGEKFIAELETGKYDFARINFANGDMVGHTGNFAATVIAVETVDLILARVLETIDKMGGCAIITADHGNADEMYEIDKKTGKAKTNPDGTLKAKTSHTLNPVPCILYDNVHSGEYEVVDTGKLGLSNIAATAVTLLGFKAPDFWDDSIIKLK
ncbi:MAG: 2,3-bisphosphoglycerate-independent phosphoglycerate mutase [Clostridia bacterium]|nr:2,3-bisphosphoglycerate-independent phosphoglycerate mutase [Clostridia bacterium]